MQKGDKVRVKTYGTQLFEVVNPGKVWVGVRPEGWSHPDDKEDAILAKFAVRATEIVDIASVPGPTVVELEPQITRTF